jgi:hypothetical protein
LKPANLLVVGVVEGQEVLVEEGRIEEVLLVKEQLSELEVECSFYC